MLSDDRVSGIGIVPIYKLNIWLTTKVLMCSFVCEINVPVFPLHCLWDNKEFLKGEKKQVRLEYCFYYPHKEIQQSAASVTERRMKPFKLWEDFWTN